MTADRPSLFDLKDPALRGVRLLTAPQVADLLAINVASVYRLMGRVRNPLVAVRFGERITRFRLIDVEKFLSVAAGGNRGGQ